MRFPAVLVPALAVVLLATPLPQRLQAQSLQLIPLAPQGPDAPKLVSPLTQPTLTPGQIELLELEAKFSADTAKGGGKAFASWFADDAVTLSNGKPPVIGRTAIAASAQWDPAKYQLSWTAAGAAMGPSGDSGYTWGHYTANFKDAQGQPTTTEGRYITFWVKRNDKWQVSLDASADDTPGAGDCCALPKP
jgi:ketosteroid isomerase-like protein